MPQRLILIADDNEDVRTISKSILESRGFAVVQAVNGEEAVEVALHHRPDLIFLDLMMPRTDGWEAMRRLGADPETRKIPVVAITAAEPPRKAVREAGFCALVTKPLSPLEMVEAVGVCLDAHERGERWIQDLGRRLSERAPRPPGGERGRRCGGDASGDPDRSAGRSEAPGGD